MITLFLPLKKLRRNVKYVLFGAILLVGLVAVYQEMLAAKAWSSNLDVISKADRISWKRDLYEERLRRDHQPHTVGDTTAWASSYAPQPWKPEYMGQAGGGFFPGPAGFPGGAAPGMPGLGEFLKDPELLNAMKDPEVMAAFQDVAQNPANIAKYQNNPKIMALVTKLSSKFGASPQP